MKIVLDCNIIISAAITDGTCRLVLKEAVAKHQIYISEEIIFEIKEVSQRPKFKKFYQNIIEILAVLFSHCDLIKIKETFNHNLPDKSDEIYLETALAAKCDYLITGNLKDFPEKKYGKTQIVTAKEFLNLFYH